MLSSQCVFHSIIKIKVKKSRLFVKSDGILYFIAIIQIFSDTPERCVAFNCCLERFMCFVNLNFYQVSSKNTKSDSSS